MKRAKYGVFLFVLMILFPYTLHAEEMDLDDSFEEFRNNYEKEEQEFWISSTEDQKEINNRRIIIQIDEGSAFDADVFGVEQVSDKNSLAKENIYVVKVPDEVNYDEKLKELRDAPEVLFAEPDFVLETTADISGKILNNQWYLKDIDLINAWNITRGSSDVTIAVLDSGVDVNHPGLTGRVLEGYNFVKHNTNIADDNGHGTHVAGIIAANYRSNDITGMDANAKILPVKVMDKKGEGTSSAALDGIYYAMERNVDVINMSFTSRNKNELLKKALEEAHKQGIVLVAAAGNDASVKKYYPASYNQVINVTSTDRFDQRASFSNYGVWTDISAPGMEIYSTAMNGGYKYDNGTSFSAPIVSALAGLIKAAQPNWDPQEIEWAIESGATSLTGKEWDNAFGFGKVNAYKSLTVNLPSLKDDAGNKSSKAKQINNDQVVTEKMDLPLDVDWFTFNIPEETELKVKLMNNSSHLSLVGVLYKEEEGERSLIKVLEGGGMGKNKKLVLNVDAGTYKLAVYDYYGRWSRDSYNVKVSYGAGVFPDVSEYEEQIRYLVQKGVIQGFPDGTFKPNDPISRLQAVNMILLERGIDPNTYNAPDPEFTDVRPGDEGYEAIAAAVDLKIIYGKEDNTFDRWGRLTRGQMAAILTRTYGLTGTSYGEFTDIPKEHEYYNEIHALAANNITTGYEDNTFRPYTKISRQHFSVFLYRKMTMEDDA